MNKNLYPPKNFSQSGSPKRKPTISTVYQAHWVTPVNHGNPNVATMQLKELKNPSGGSSQSVN